MEGQEAGPQDRLKRVNACMKLMVFFSTATSVQAGGFRGALGFLRGLKERGLELHVRAMYASHEAVESLSRYAECKVLHLTNTLPHGLLYSELLFHKASGELVQWMQRRPDLFRLDCAALLFGDFPIRALSWARGKGLLRKFAVYAWGIPTLYPHFSSGRSALDSSGSTARIFQFLSPILDSRLAELREADLVIPVTEWLAHLLVMATGCPCAGSVPLPVETDVFRPAVEPPVIHGRYALAVGGAGDLDFKAIRRIAKSVRLVRAGNGTIANCENIGFITDQVKLRNLYTYAEFLVNSPTLEPYGMIPLESMACGTPVISTIYPGIGEYCPDGTRHLLASTTEDLENLARRTWGVGLNPQLRALVRDHMVRQFSHRVLSEQLLARVSQLS